MIEMTTITLLSSRRVSFIIQYRREGFIEMDGSLRWTVNLNLVKQKKETGNRKSKNMFYPTLMHQIYTKHHITPPHHNIIPIIINQ